MEVAKVKHNSIGKYTTSGAVSTRSEEKGSNDPACTVFSSYDDEATASAGTKEEEKKSSFNNTAFTVCMENTC